MVLKRNNLVRQMVNIVRKTVLFSFVLGLSVNGIAYAQEEFVIVDIMPTLTGNQNRATLFGGLLWGEWVVRIEIKNGPGDRFIFAKGGVKLFGSGRLEFGEKGETILSSECDTETIYSGIENNHRWFTGNIDYEGSEYTITGKKLHLLGYAFESDKERPLIFKLFKGKGFVYVSGKGTVTLKDGKEIKLGN